MSKEWREQRGIEKLRNAKGALRFEAGLPVEAVELEERICDAYRKGDAAEAWALEHQQELVERRARSGM